VALKRLRLSTELGDAAAVECSPRLTRVLQNLLQNAIRHTPEDGTIRVHARQAGPVLELAVEDSGEGIEPAAAERVFEPFWRGDAARASQGSGLGLALTKRIVESLGGTIAVEPATPGGARFAVMLPRSD
jgi:signal transduction histidine kinase